MGERSGKTSRRSLLWLGAVASAGLAIGLLLLRPLPAAAPAGTTAGSRLPRLVGDALEGPAPSLDLDGDVVVVASWAAWCDPCRRLVHDLSALDAEHRSEGLRVVGLAQDSDASVARAFAAEAGLGFVSLHDPLGALTLGAWGWTTMPTLIVADRSGVVRFRHEGYRTGEAEGIATEIESLLSDAP